MTTEGSGRRTRIWLSLRTRMRTALEWLGRPLLYAGLTIVRLYRPSFHHTSRHLYTAADRMGVFPLIDHYHDPPVRRVPGPRRPRALASIDLRIDEQLSLLRQLTFAEELESITLTECDLEPYYGNPAFAAPDAQAYYSLIRHFCPKRVLEIGSGQSTRFAARAVAMNRRDGVPGEVMAIEPYESPELEALGVSVVRQRVEDVQRDVFGSLAANDVLFIDSSHVVRPGGDVTLLLLEVVPRLAPGVLIHVHDVFTPNDPPDEWQRRRWFWPEQYVLEALLIDNPRLAVVLAVSHLLSQFPAEIAAAFPVPQLPGPGPTPGSFWIRSLGDAPVH